MAEFNLIASVNSIKVNELVNKNGSESNKSVLGFDSKRAKVLLETAWKSIQHGHYTDVTFTVGDRIFPAHRLVLVSLSDYFTPLFKLDEKGTGEVVLKNVSPEDFEVLLKYAYSGELEVTLDNVQNVLIAADYFSIDFVKEQCFQYMKNHFDCDNICEVLIFSRNYTFADLEHFAEEFIKENLESVSKTTSFSMLDPEYLFRILNDDNLVLLQNNFFLKKLHREFLIFKSVLRYLSSRKEQSPDIFEMLLSAVRLPELPSDWIKKCLKDHKDLSKNDTIKKYLKLRDLAIKCNEKKKHDNSFLSDLATKAKEVPESWFRRRKLSTYALLSQNQCYGAGGEVVLCDGPPSISTIDPFLEIQNIELWIRLWDGRKVIGGLKIIYRKTNSPGKTVEYIKGSHQNAVNHHLVELQPQEMITRVIIGSGWLIDRLGFQTNLGHTHGPFGGPGGIENVELAPTANFSYLYGIFCDSTKTQGSDALFNLIFKWIKFY